MQALLDRVRTSIASGVLLFMASAFVQTKEAWADLIAPAPNSAGCSQKKVGDACQDDQKNAGTCAAQKCSRTNRVQLPDGGWTPGKVEYDCTVCVAGSTPAASGSAAPAAASATSSGSGKSGGCNASAVAADEAGSALALGAIAVLITQARRRRRS